jgi:hypothetical protein
MNSEKQKTSKVLENDVNQYLISKGKKKILENMNLIIRINLNPSKNEH